MWKHNEFLLKILSKGSRAPIRSEERGREGLRRGLLGWSKRARAEIVTVNVKKDYTIPIQMS